MLDNSHNIIYNSIHKLNIIYIGMVLNDSGH